MLITVKRYIEELPNRSFAEFFRDYMISVQDSNIDREFRSLISKNKYLNVRHMEHLIKNTFERMGAMS